jgi:hypothetical protein
MQTRSPCILHTYLKCALLVILGMPHARIGHVDVSGRMVVSPSLACFLVDNYYIQDKEVARNCNGARGHSQAAQPVLITG